MDNRNIRTQDQAVIFDMDGLMFDSERIGWMSMSQAAEEFGVELTMDIYMNFCGMNKEGIALRMRDFWDDDLAEALASRTFEIRSGLLLTEKIDTMPYLKELLAFLKEKGVRTAIASSSRRHEILDRLKFAEIDHPFDAIMSGEDIVNSKPHPEIYLKTLALLGIDPAEAYGRVFVLEDSRNGLRSGHAAGCTTVFIPDMWLPAEDEDVSYMDYRFADLSGVMSLFS